MLSPPNIKVQKIYKEESPEGRVESAQKVFDEMSDRKMLRHEMPLLPPNSQTDQAGHVIKLNHWKLWDNGIKPNIGDYEIKLNHRKLLDGMLDICGVPPEKFRTVCSTIDALNDLDILFKALEKSSAFSLLT
jgi:hypothetical protein